MNVNNPIEPMLALPLLASGLENAVVLPTPSKAERDIAIASNRHCTAHDVLGHGAGVRIQCESGLERSHAFIINSRLQTYDFREQVSFPYPFKDSKTRHIFDFYVTEVDGRRIACTVKPDARTRKRGEHQMPGEDFITHMQTVSFWVQERNFADEVRLLTEKDIDPVELHNAHALAAFRDPHPDPDADAAAWELTRHLVGGRSLRDLTRDLGLAERGYRALLRLVRMRALVGQPGHRLTPDILIFRKGTIQ
ncbi:hypothetical protein GL279_17460 [Paracoccus limosus]|uniref:TnsA endonuclease N-terminal domain-containing protein n=1 Tax=Paracoccus limosus TaxID=913252 RepID=A0A844H911_9RHOB|nr:hypothetical protein [Paracoccus limosus]MTH36384.1 hypothetical protein [Paracoccus limosus]